MRSHLCGLTVLVALLVSTAGPAGGSDDTRKEQPASPSGIGVLFVQNMGLTCPCGVAYVTAISIRVSTWS